jgi:hypothetical protein
MKKHFPKKTLRLSFLSLLALGTFIFLATGSLLDMAYETTEYLGDGVYEASKELSSRETQTITGPVDLWDRWNGPVTIVCKYIAYQPWDQSEISTEKVTMVHGLREGKSVMTTTDLAGNIIQVRNNCYKNGSPIPCAKSAQSVETDVSSFQILGDSYPWYLYMLNTYSYDDIYVQAYLDTMDVIMGKHQLGGDSVFFDFYDEAIDILAETPYDSMLVLNSTLTLFQGLDELKNHEFRRAVIERHRLDGVGTYTTVETTYSPYLSFLSESGVSVQDFNSFCHVLDSIMDSYGSLDKEHPFFTDSVDNRLSIAISEIMDSGSSSDPGKKSAYSFREYLTITNALQDFNSLVSSSSATDSAVASVVVMSMLAMLIEGDIIHKVTQQAFMENNNVPQPPRVSTEFSSNNSPTSVTLNGYIIEDGGAEVISKGIVWATYYNPTLDDNYVTSGTGIGSFTAALDGLTEGMTYYARTFATNSAGTAYGNCVEFTATSTSGIGIAEFDHDLKVYPNPASSITKFSFRLESPESMVLTIVNLKGQVVYQNDLGTYPQGKNQVVLDLSELKSGIYHNQLSVHGKVIAERKLVILH